MTHIELMPLTERAEIYVGAAEILGDSELGKTCRSAAAAIRAAELHQLTLSGLLREARQ